MRDDNGGDATVFVLDASYGLIVNVCDAVPEDVSFGRDAEEGALGDCKVGLRVDADQLAVLCG